MKKSNHPDSTAHKKSTQPMARVVSKSKSHKEKYIATPPSKVLSNIAQRSFNCPYRKEDVKGALQITPKPASDPLQKETKSDLAIEGRRVEIDLHESFDLQLEERKPKSE